MTFGLAMAAAILCRPLAARLGAHLAAKSIKHRYARLDAAFAADQEGQAR
jgi:hypothetical protein